MTHLHPCPRLWYPLFSLHDMVHDTPLCNLTRNALIHKGKVNMYINSHPPSILYRLEISVILSIHLIQSPTATPLRRARVSFPSSFTQQSHIPTIFTFPVNSLGSVSMSVHPVPYDIALFILRYSPTQLYSLRIPSGTLLIRLCSFFSSRSQPPDIVFKPRYSPSLIFSSRKSILFYSQ